MRTHLPVAFDFYQAAWYKILELGLLLECLKICWFQLKNISNYESNQIAVSFAAI